MLNSCRCIEHRRVFALLTAWVKYSPVQSFAQVTCSSEYKKKVVWILHHQAKWSLETRRWVSVTMNIGSLEVSNTTPLRKVVSCKTPATVLYKWSFQRTYFIYAVRHHVAKQRQPHRPIHVETSLPPHVAAFLEFLVGSWLASVQKCGDYRNMISAKTHAVHPSLLPHRTCFGIVPTPGEPFDAIRPLKVAAWFSYTNVWSRTPAKMRHVC